MNQHNNFRKRDREQNSEDIEEIIFGNSRKVIRSPDYKKTRGKEGKKSQNRENENPTAGMDEIRDLKKMIVEMMEEIRNNTKENRELREEMRKREEEWRKEKEDLYKRIEVLEERTEKEERAKRKMNLVLKGIKIKSEEPEMEIENFFKKNLGVETKIKKINKIRSENEYSITVVEMETWDMKQRVMKNKNKLKGSHMYIENDLTVEERKIQAQIRAIAKREKEKGKKVKVGYKKITINGEEYDWNQKENGVVAGNSTQISTHSKNRK